MKYAENTVRIMRHQIEAAKRAAIHHYRHRHDGRGSRLARQWIAEARRLDRSSGYSEALRSITR